MSAGVGLLSSSVELVLQTLAYGVFFVLAVVSTILLVKRGWRNRNSIIMLCMIWTMFILSTAHWTINLVFTISQIISSASLEEFTHPLHDLLTAVGKANYAVADAVLVWRAWVLCKQEYRKPLLACFVCLGLTSLFIVMTIILRLACNARPEGQSPPLLDHALDVSQVGMLIVSTLTNLLSTGIVGIYVWKYLPLIRAAFVTNGETEGTQVLLLIVESGLLYTTYVFFSIISSLIRIPTGTIGDLTASVLIHISGVYPTILITLARIQGTVNSSAFSVRPSRTTGAQSGGRSANIVFAHISPTEGSTSRFRTPDSAGSWHPETMLPSVAFYDFEDDAMKYLEEKWEHGQLRMSGHPTTA